MLTQEKLKELIDYNQETGIFTNKVTRNSRAVKGAQLNPKNHGRYGVVTINKIKYRLHRLAWFYVYGIWPENQIDHINGDTTDNRICNLRDATNQQNQYNSKVINKSSKFKGVHFESFTNKWKVQIRINKKQVTIGRYKTEVEAAKAYDSKAKEVFGEFARLNFGP